MGAGKGVRECEVRLEGGGALTVGEVVCWGWGQCGKAQESPLVPQKSSTCVLLGQRSTVKKARARCSLGRRLTTLTS